MRLSLVSINFPLVIRRPHESEAHGRQIARNALYDYCDLQHIADNCEPIVRKARTIFASPGEGRTNTTGDPVKDSGIQTHAFKVRWSDLFESIFPGFESSTFKAYSHGAESSAPQNIKVVLCHPGYPQDGSDVSRDLLREAVENARQSDSSERRNLMSSEVLAHLFVNPVQRKEDPQIPGASAAYGDDKFTVNLVIRPIIPTLDPFVINRSKLCVSHDVVDGIREVFVQEFDSR